jgi:hypothetical protein
MAGMGLRVKEYDILAITKKVTDISRYRMCGA